jgi:hypothetical protein
LNSHVHRIKKIPLSRDQFFIEGVDEGLSLVSFHRVLAPFNGLDGFQDLRIGFGFQRKKGKKLTDTGFTLVFNQDLDFEIGFFGCLDFVWSF